VITKVRGSFVVCFHLTTLIVLSQVLRTVSARPRTCVLSSLEHCTGDVVSRPRGKMVRSGVMKGKASTEERAGGGGVCDHPALPALDELSCFPQLSLHVRYVSLDAALPPVSALSCPPRARG
jgi:hypothetical protein